MPGKTYDKAPEELTDTVAQVLDMYHSRLTSPTILRDVQIETMLAYGPRNGDGDQTGPAIQVHGTEALACIRITKLEERIAGRGDAVMLIDGDRWKGWQRPQLEALIDHELTHLELQRDPRTDEIVLDDAGRVKLKMRSHDFQVGWFDEVAERHPKWSWEVQQAMALANSRQMYFPGFDITPRVRKKRA